MAIVNPNFVYSMGIDGGGTTGWGIIGVERASIFGQAKSQIRQFEHGQVTGSYTQQVLTLMQIIKTYHNPYYSLALAVESFSPRKPITSEEFFSPLQINARLQFLVDTHEIKSPLFYQTPSMAMENAPDKRLKRWGLYTPGPDHIKDGTRHAITFIRRCRADNTLAERAWPLAIEQPGRHSYPISQIIRNKSHP
jgi:hypothetical protein